MLFDDKKLVSVRIIDDIVGKLRKRKPSFVEDIGIGKMPQRDEMRKEYKPGYEQAAHEMIKAAQKNDPVSFAYSLKNFIEMCCDEMDMGEDY